MIFMETLKDIGEIEAIERVCRRLGSRADVVVGPGDDCAVVREREGALVDWLLTSDPVIEGVHFARDTPPALVGRKAIGRALSDLAAMGGEPRWALLNAVAPADTPVSAMEAIAEGADALAREHGLAIVGGDMARGPALELHVFAAGTVPAGRALLRSGARPGDGLYVTGELGGSRLGRHLSFEPRVREGVFLRDWAGGMIDVSDGLSTDLHHLAERSAAGAVLDLAALPVAQAAREIGDGRSPQEHALHDGEDFELLFSVPAAREPAFAAAWPRAFPLRCTRIGEVTGRRGAVEVRGADGRLAPLARSGFEHWRGARACGREGKPA